MAFDFDFLSDVSAPNLIDLSSTMGGGADNVEIWIACIEQRWGWTTSSGRAEATGFEKLKYFDICKNQWK